MLKQKARVLLSVHAISHTTCSGCWNSVQHAYGQVWLSTPCVVHVCTFVWYSVAQGCAMLSHILMSVVCMQLLHVEHMHSLRLTPPTISCIHLVVWLNVTVKFSNCSSVVLPVPIQEQLSHICTSNLATLATSSLYTSCMLFTRWCMHNAPLQCATLALWNISLYLYRSIHRVFHFF